MSVEQKNLELNLNDLLAVRNLIEVVTQRGAFRANELSAVGALFDKLNAFLEESKKPQEEEPTQESGQGE